jgi:UDP-2,3-diacylglucosamine hydrolase
MDHSLFVSDLHLCESRPHITSAFMAFLADTASHAQALYILGDLFEYWAGDDAMASGAHQSIIRALKKLSRQNVQIYFMHGNRDFLLGEDFAKATGATFLADPSLITLYGKPVLLSHGDKLCTDDVAYQEFRKEVRSSAWQQQFLNQPLAKRIAYIEQLRAKSEQAKSTKSMQIMDVNAAELESMLGYFNYPPLFIHGHTHRPNKHTLTLQGHSCERWVLGDWYEQGSYLKLSANGCHAQALRAT